MSDRIRIEPDFEPQYRQKAVLVDGEQLVNRSGQTIADIAKRAGHHVNTVSRKLKGDRGAYVIVHDCFTAINRITANAFVRSAHVKYCEGPEDVTDPNLDQCLVFPNLRSIMSKAGMKDIRALGDASGVQTRFVDAMLAGRPVSENLVRAVFNQLNKDQTLNEKDELFR